MKTVEEWILSIKDDKIRMNLYSALLGVGVKVMDIEVEDLPSAIIKIPWTKAAMSGFNDISYFMELYNRAHLNKVQLSEES